MFAGRRRCERKEEATLLERLERELKGGMQIKIRWFFCRIPTKINIRMYGVKYAK